LFEPARRCAPSDALWHGGNETPPQVKNEIMKTKNLFPCLGKALIRSWILPALIAALKLLPAGRVTAQTFTTLHSVTGGVSRFGGLVLSSNTLYGTTYWWDDNGGGYGTVFAISTDGTDFRNLPGASMAGLIVSGNTLYGTMPGDSQPFSGNSTVFSVNTDGTGFTNLHTFASVPDYGPFINADGTQPRAGVILSGNTLYGTAYFGGPGGDGTVFAVKTNGTGFTVLHSFTGGSDGENPVAGLILSGNTLYGTTPYAGSSVYPGYGNVFAVSTDGTGFTNLHSFTAPHTNSSGVYTNSDGAEPDAGLILSGSTLYGTANYGGSSGRGTVFAVKTNGTGFTNVYSFTAAPYGTNSDGANPQAGLILVGNTLYGTALYGGSSGQGTVFAVNTNGTGFTNLHSFTGASDGGNPSAGLVLSGSTLYGTAVNGGSSGTVFSLSFRPQLTITPSGVPPSGIILTWPTNVAGFDYTGYTLQSTTNLVSPAVWSTNSPAPVVIAGQNTVTNSITAAQQFYRLIR